MEKFYKKTIKDMRDHECIYCGAKNSIEVVPTIFKKSVTSDCKVCDFPARLGVCKFCNYIQTITDKIWQNTVENIYKNYNLYEQSKGNEQKIFTTNRDFSTTRSEIISKLLLKIFNNLYSIKLLDFGCGKGHFLNYLANSIEKIDLYGFEISDNNKNLIIENKKIKNFFTDINKINIQFDCITYIHSFEHLPRPFENLLRIKDLLNDGGIILIQLPNCEENPFMLNVIDHSQHYSINTLLNLVESCGYKIIYISDNTIPREITLIAKLINRDKLVRINNLEKSSNKFFFNGIIFLENFINDCKKIINSSYYIFGSAIAATWVYGELGGNCVGFIDEDINKIKNTHMNLEIIHPTNCNSEIPIIVPLPINTALSVKKRLQSFIKNKIFVPNMLF